MPDVAAATEPPRIQCAEIWGGNHSAHAPVALPGLEGMLYSRSCSGGRGGDIHYLSMCGSGLLSRVCLADVAGHGECVSQVGRMAHEMLRVHVNTADQRRLLRRLNVSLTSEGIHALTTAAVMTYYPPSRRLTISYAGHPPAWYYSARRRAWRRLMLDDADLKCRETALVNGPLAVQKEAVFSRSRIRTEQGDRLLLVTDGVLEAHDGSFEQFGTTGVETAIDAHADGGLRAVSDALLAALAAHCGTHEFTHDDISFVLLEFVEAPAGPALWHVIRNRVLRPLGVVSHPPPGLDPA